MSRNIFQRWNSFRDDFNELPDEFPAVNRDCTPFRKDIRFHPRTATSIGLRDVGI